VLLLLLLLLLFAVYLDETSVIRSRANIFTFPLLSFKDTVNRLRREDSRLEEGSVLELKKDFNFVFRIGRFARRTRVSPSRHWSICLVSWSMWERICSLSIRLVTLN